MLETNTISAISMWALLCDNDLRERGRKQPPVYGIKKKSSLFEPGRSLCDQNKSRG